jgi:hypothetical protein
MPDALRDYIKIGLKYTNPADYFQRGFYYADSKCRGSDSKRLGASGKPADRPVSVFAGVTLVPIRRTGEALAGILEGRYR